jgi:predicted Abi (CAAX) family protease
MKVYDYLFYSSYKSAVKSGNFDDTPVIGAITVVVMCVMFNIFTLSFLLNRFGILVVTLKSEYKYLFVLALTSIILYYYLYNQRYRRILLKYEKREEEQGRRLHPIVVMIIYYAISGSLMFLAALFMNGDWRNTSI